MTTFPGCHCDPRAWSGLPRGPFGGRVGAMSDMPTLAEQQKRVDALREVLFGRHPYETPEFIVIPIDRIEGVYREWLLDAVSAG